MKNLFLLISLALILGGGFSEPVQAENPELLDIKSEAAVLLDAKSGQILYEKNGAKRMFPASTTKVATAILAIEEGNLEAIATVSQNARNADGTRVYLEEGEQVPLKKLVQGLLINSGNDAGIAIAEHMDGSVEQFAGHLNSFLKTKVGVENTNFTNPHGLFDENHWTSAADLAKITQYALKNDTFREIFGTKRLRWVGTGWDTTLVSHHRLMTERPYEGIIGGKTGYVTESGHTLVTAAERNGLTLVAVAMKPDYKKNIYNDTVNLFDFGFANYESVTVASGKEFSNAFEEKFLLKEPFIFTKKIKENIELKVSHNNELVAIGEDGRIIRQVPLEAVKPAPATEKKGAAAKKEKAPESKSVPHQVSLMNFAWLAAAGAAVAGAAYFRRSRVRLKQ